MYTLFKNLKDLGQEVFLAEKHRNTHLIPGLQDELTDEDYISEGEDLSDYIAIYPEVTKTNPLGCKHVTRWFLHYPGFHGISYHHWQPDTELYFAYADWIAEHSLSLGFHCAGKLVTIYNNFDVFKDHKSPNRAGTCYVTRKGNAGYRDPLPRNAVSIEAETNAEDVMSTLPSIFNKYENFYSYDEDTYLLLLAALCGCNSVVASRTQENKDDYFSQRSEAFGVGIAYGIKEIEYAKATKHLVKEKLQNLENEAIDTVKAFINITQSEFTS